MRGWLWVFLLSPLGIFIEIGWGDGNEKYESIFDFKDYLKIRQGNSQ